jgi:hypothetical protein
LQPIDWFHFQFIFSSCFSFSQLAIHDAVVVSAQPSRAAVIGRVASPRTARRSGRRRSLAADPRAIAAIQQRNKIMEFIGMGVVKKLR